MNNRKERTKNKRHDYEEGKKGQEKGILEQTLPKREHRTGVDVTQMGGGGGGKAGEGRCLPPYEGMKKRESKGEAGLLTKHANSQKP